MQNIAGKIDIYFNEGLIDLKRQKTLCGDAGYRSRYLPHAKRALYHLSYTPTIYVLSVFLCTFNNTSGENYLSLGIFQYITSYSILTHYKIWGRPEIIKIR